VACQPADRIRAPEGARGGGRSRDRRIRRGSTISIRATLAAMKAISRLLEHLRARVINALTRYLARPLDEFSTLATVDRQALAAVLRSGDVLLCAGNTRCAEVVKRLTRSTWSHVSMYVGPLEDAPDPLCIVEADIAVGVRAIRLSDLDARRISVLRPVGLDDAERARLTESVLRHVGSEYDLAHAWLLARSLFVRRWWARLRSVPTTMGRSATRFICSSLIAQAFALIGHAILPAGGTVSDREQHHNSLVPADFERASLFAIVWPVNAPDGRT
jgi:hypothetical protein